MSDKVTRLKTIIRNALATWALLAAAIPVLGDVIGTPTVNGDGTVTYAYVVNNSGGTFDVSAWSLEFGFPSPDWNPLDVLSGGKVNVPNAKWFADAGIPVTGQSAQDFLALAPDGDVLVGQSLGGFSFTSRFLPGTITYDEFSADGSSITGTTIGPVSAVPEAGGLLQAIAFGAVMAFAAGTRALRREQPARRGL